MAGRDLQKNGLEWTVFAVSLALVALVVALLAWEAAEDADVPPRLVVTLGTPGPGLSGVRVPVSVRNDGAQTVSSVLVEVTDGRETAEVSFGYVPRHSTRTGGALFPAPPGRLQARVVAYEAP
jgi:uncharacterized protein (TIGR02588 family)